MILGTFRIGEDLAIALDATADIVAASSAVTAFIQPSRAGDVDFIPMPGSTRLEMTVTERPVAVGDIPAGWTLSLTAEQTTSLDAEVYGIDARIEFDDAVEITEQTAFVQLTRAVASP